MVSDRDVDPELVANWLRARSIARGLPQPYPSHGGLCVETNSPAERRRYLFARPCDGLRELAATITEPRIMLKLCGNLPKLAAQLPDRWELLAPAAMMVRTGSDFARLPNGYRAELSTTDLIHEAKIFAPEGSLAASGYAIESFGVYCYDRIVTDQSHRRLGLGRAVMQCLHEQRRSQNSQQILTATEMGRHLYLASGWTIYSPFATAHIPGNA